MADFTKTVTNSINCFGLEQPSVWGSMLWGTDNWGYGQTTATDVEKNILDNIVTPTDDYFLATEKVLDNSIPSTQEMTEETLQDGKGYYYVFTKPSLDAEDRNLNNYTEDSGASTTWTEDSRTSTGWVEE
jgi:hypothetical protein